MLLRCKESTVELIEGNEYIAMAMKVGSNKKEVLVYNSWSSFVDINLFEPFEEHELPGDWIKSPIDNLGNYYLGYKEFVSDPTRHYLAIIERVPEDLKVYNLEYTKQVLNDPEARVKTPKYDPISKLDLFPDFADIADKKASDMFLKIQKTDALMIVYFLANAPWSLRMEAFLQEKKINYLPVDITDNPTLLNYVIDTLGQYVAPVCVANEKIIAVGYEPEATLESVL